MQLVVRIKACSNSLSERYRMLTHSLELVLSSSVFFKRGEDKTRSKVIMTELNTDNKAFLSFYTFTSCVTKYVPYTVHI